jgi:hypothetical protein
MLMAGCAIVWMGLSWYSDGANGLIGGGPFVSFTLQHGEQVTRAVPAVFRETTKRSFGSFGAAFENNMGRLYLTDRRLIFCPSRFRPDQRTVSIAYRDIRQTDDDPPWQMNLARAGMTLTLEREQSVAIWFKDQSIIEQLRAWIRDGEPISDVPTNVGHIHGTVVLFAIGWGVVWSIVVVILVLSVDTPGAIIAFFVLSALVGLFGIGPLVVKYVRQVRSSAPNSLS